MKTLKGMHAVRNPSRKTLRRLLAALALLAAVVIGFSLTVFAYFTDSLVNSGNTIVAGSFAADVEVVAEDGRLLYGLTGVLGCDESVELADYAGQTVYVKVAPAAGSTVAFQFRLTAEKDDGQVLFVVPQTGDNPVLEPQDQPLTYTVSVPANGRILLRLRTAFRAAQLTGAPTKAVVTTAETTTTAEDTTTAGDVTITAEDTTTAGEMTTTAEDTTTAGDVTITAEDTTTAADVTTTAAEDTTTAADVTTQPSAPQPTE